MRIKTGIRYDRRRAYRLIGRDLYSAPQKQLLYRQAYILEKAGIIAGKHALYNWNIVVQRGIVCLDNPAVPEETGQRDTQQPAPVPQTSPANRSVEGPVLPQGERSPVQPTPPAHTLPAAPRPVYRNGNGNHHGNGNGNHHGNGHNDVLLRELLQAAPEHQPSSPPSEPSTNGNGLHKHPVHSSKQHRNGHQATSRNATQHMDNADRTLLDELLTRQL